MRTKLKDIARLAEVSIATASYVLNDQWEVKGIRQETAQRVMDLAEEHRFVPNRTATFLKKGRYHLIALISPHCADFYSDLLQGIEEQGEKQDYQILFCSTFNSAKREENYLRSLIARRVDGVIILPVDIHESHMEYLIKNRVPTVCFRRRASSDLAAKYMTFNDREGGKIAAKHLLAQGCQRIAFVSDTICEQYDYLKIIQEARAQGCIEALEEAGRPADELTVFVHDSGCPDYPEVIRDALSENKIDGVVGFSDMACVVLCRALRQVGLCVPKDLRVVGFDNTELGALFDPGLTSIGLPKPQLGRLMVDAIMRMIDSRQQETDEFFLSPYLIPRASTA